MKGDDHDLGKNACHTPWIKSGHKSISDCSCTEPQNRFHIDRTNNSMFDLRNYLAMADLRYGTQSLPNLDLTQFLLLKLDRDSIQIDQAQLCHHWPAWPYCHKATNTSSFSSSGELPGAHSGEPSVLHELSQAHPTDLQWLLRLGTLFYLGYCSSFCKSQICLQ